MYNTDGDRSLAEIIAAVTDITLRFAAGSNAIAAED